MAKLDPEATSGRIAVAIAGGDIDIVILRPDLGRDILLYEAENYEEAKRVAKAMRVVMALAKELANNKLAKVKL